MKRLSIIILILLFAGSSLAGPDAIKKVIAAKMMNGGATPSASYILNAAGGSGSQIYNSIAAEWEGGGSDTVDFTSGYLVADSTTDRCYAPGSRIQTSSSMTIYFEYQVSAADIDLRPLFYSSGGDDIIFYHYNASGTGRFLFKSNYATPATLTFSNSSYALNTWHTVYLHVDVAGTTLNAYIDGSVVSGKTEANFANIADQSTLAGGLYAGDLNANDGTISIRNLRVYSGVVTP